MPPARRHAVQIKPNRMSGFHPLTCCGLTPALTAHVCTQGQGRRRARLLWGKRVNSKRLGKGCGKSREREAWGAGPYKAPPNTSQALSCSSVPRFRTSQETLSSPPGSPLHTLAHYHWPHLFTLTHSPSSSLSPTRQDGFAKVENEWALEEDGGSSAALCATAQQWVLLQSLLEGKVICSFDWV